MSRMGTFSANIDGVTVTVKASSKRVAANKIVAKTGKHLSEVKRSGVCGSGAHSGHHSGQRAEYWYFFLCNLIVAIALGIIGAVIGHNSNILGMLYCLAVFIPNLAVIVRRLHDIGKSGWWILIGLIPLIGPIWLLVLLVIDSNPGDNKYGSNPKKA